MKNKIKLIIPFLIFLIIFFIFGNVKATEESNILIETSTEQLNQEEEITLLIKFNNIKQVSTFQAKIIYDENVFEKISDANFETQNDWESLRYNDNNKNFIIVNKKAISNNDILKVKFKVKSDAQAGNTSIKIENILESDGVNEFTEKNAETVVEIKQEKQENKDNENEISNEVQETDSKKEDNKQVKDWLADVLPKTGIGRFLLIAVIISIIIAIIWLIKIKKIDKKILKNTMVIVLGILIFANNKNTFATSSVFKGNLNNDSIINDSDIEILEDYLIGKEKSILEENADMSSDGKISIIDLSLLLKQQEDCPYDKNNVTNISYWKTVPIVSKELLQKNGVTTGGEGCQWPVGMDISEDGKLLLYGTDVGGIYRSTDGGLNWEQSNAGLESRGAGAFSIDPKNSNYILAVGINGNSYNTNGLFISEDSGKTWKMTKSMLITGRRDIRESIKYDESSYNKEKNRCMIAYWSTEYETEKNQLKEDEKGLYKTIDGGYTWNNINKDLCDGTVKINPISGDLYVSKKDGIYYSSDKGNSFEKIVNSKISGFDLINNNGNIIIYYCNNDGVFISTDVKNFEKINSTSYPTDEPLNIKVSKINPNNMLLINKKGTYENYPYYSNDGGKTWKKSILSNDLSFMPYNNRASIPMWSTVDENKVWIYTQGDYASSSVDSGKTFNWDSNGITGILSGGNVHYNVYNPDIIYFGSQDYDGCVSIDGGQTWKYISMSGNRWGGFCYGGYAVDENTYFVGVATGWNEPRKLKITFDGGKTIVDTGMYFTRENIRTSIESSYQSPTNPKILFACDLRSTDGGHTWNKMNGCINVYTHNPRNKQELYGMDETGKFVVVSYDNGETWSKVNKEELKTNGSYVISDIGCDWKNEMLYVACGGNYLYRISIKDGSSEYVLNKNIDEYKKAPLNLKNNYIITKVAVDPNDPRIIYCGGPGNTYMNDCSLYRTVDGGKTFQVITSNTKNSIIRNGKQGGFETNSLEVNPKTGELLFAGGCFGISKLTPPY